MENRNGMGMQFGNRNYQRKMSDEGYHANIQVRL